jgi:SdrD B-like domain/PKD domain
MGTTTTTATGAYTFGNLPPGTYSVSFTTPAGFVPTGSNLGGNDNTDSDPINGVVTGIVLGAGQTITNVDAGFRGTGSIGDFVWSDTNGNGIQEAGEVGINGVTVELKNAAGVVIATTTTNSVGYYQFTGLVAGTYTLQFVTPSGYAISPAFAGSNPAIDSDIDVNSGTVTVTLANGESNQTIDAGYVLRNLSLGDRVWYDQNNNGIQDAGETGIAGATVRLYNASGTVIGSTTTSATGIYNFAGLTPGKYSVGVDVPTGYAPAATTVTSGTPDNDNNTDNNGITLTGSTLFTKDITLTAGGEPVNDGDASANSNLSLDLGLRGTGSIGDYVFNDANANGIQDITEVGIVGATVTLTYPNGTTVSTTTGTGGIYNFPNLAPGIYSVTFTTPAGLSISPSNVTTPGATDANDSDPVGGVVSGIVLTAGQVNNTIDAGFYACTLSTVSFTGPLTICANEGALFNAVGQGAGSVYTWTFNGGTPATGTGSSFTSSWSTPGEYDITLTVTKNGCTGSFTRSIIITQAVTANAGPDADVCSGGNVTIVGAGPIGATYSWTVVSGDPTSIDNGTNQSSVLVSPLVTTVYQLTVSQGGCTRIDQVTVSVNVNKNPIANAGPNKLTKVGTPVVIGGSPTGTPPVAQPTAPLGYTWSPSTGLNDATIANPTVTINTPGTYNYQVIVYNQLTGCSDTSLVSVTVENVVNVGNRVFYDKNNNGIQDATDQGIAGVTVNLYADADGNNVPDAAAIATTTTVGTTGTYNFGNLFAGKYIVGVVMPTGYVAGATTATSAVTDNDNNTDNNGVNASSTEIRSNFVTLTVGGEPAVGVDGDGTNGNLTVDFGLTGTAKLGNFVWQDQNRNGIQDAGEVGIANAVVTLTYPDGTLLNTTTSGTGAYSFNNLQPGTYNVKFTTPVGYTATLANVTTAGATDLNDSDPNATGNVTGIVLNAGDNNQTVDAGFYPPLNIFGNVWHDVNGLNNNQINNTIGATPIPSGLFIYLVNLNTGLIEQREIVLNDGTYSFLDVSAATSYKIVYSTNSKLVGETPPKSFLPSGWIKVGENLGTGINSGSDGIANGELFIDTEFMDIYDANFGIRKKNGEVVIG